LLPDCLIHIPLMGVTTGVQRAMRQIKQPHACKLLRSSGLYGNAQE
jgi:hypothetical protein